jgi:hypothetical protein
MDWAQLHHHLATRLKGKFQDIQQILGNEKKS